MPPFTSIGRVLDEAHGIGKGFDTLRILLSVTIFCWHSIVTSYGRGAELPFWANPLTGGLVASLLPVFFALSGFLVMGSAIRTMSLRVFLAARVLRILPALATEIAVSAVILGSLVTTLPLIEYFLHPGFVKYFGSLLGRIQVSLPGVFTENPFNNIVNSSLWTIAPEILCYAYIALVMAVGLLTRRTALTVLTLLLTVVAAAAEVSVAGQQHLSVSLPAHSLVLAFALGNLAYLWRHAIPCNRWLFAFCLVMGVALAGQPGYGTLALPFLVYVTVYLGLMPLPRIPLLHRGDYSYGIYLYAMPVQQTVAHAFPHLREWYWNILLALPITILLAMLSWALVEKPALRLRRHLTDRAEHRKDKHIPLAAPQTIAAIILYAIWLASTQYRIPFVSQNRNWFLAAAMICVGVNLILEVSKGRVRAAEASLRVFR